MAKRLSAIFIPNSSKLETTNSQTTSAGPDDMLSSQRRPSTQSSDSQPRSKSPAPSRLQKSGANPNHARTTSSGGKLLPPTDNLPSQPTLQDLKQSMANREDLGALPPMPPPRVGSPHSSRPASRDGSLPGTPVGSRPGTPTLLVSGSPVTSIASEVGSGAEKKERKRSWFGGGRKKDNEPKGPPAWVAGHPQKLAYDHNLLFDSQPLPELWDQNNGNCLVYLFPKTSGKGPSFKVDSAILASSPLLTRLAFGELYSYAAVQSGDRKQMPFDARMQNVQLQHSTSDGMSSDSSRDSRGRYSNFEEGHEVHLFLPVKLNSDSGVPINPKDANGQQAQDLQTLIDYRNMFAFLCGQLLVATERRHSFFQIFMKISQLLKTYEFSNLDGSTFGEVASSSFDNYVEELALNDVRNSREKTIDGIVLGESMRSVLLYNEAFTHAVGRHDEIVAMRSPKFGLISSVTRNRLSRAALDLEKRTASIRTILEDFDFPSVFSGIMSSKTAEERKEGVRFDAWRSSFLEMRKYVMSLYKHRYGNWPPKASSKKNELETSGLNRIVLRDVYHDLSSMYDLIVDRNGLTTRTVDGIQLGGARDEPTVRGLRSVLSEYDRSSPPVKPPIPFDLPTLPNLKSTRADFGTGDKKKDAKALSKKLKDDEISRILRKSWNDDAIVTPFVEAFRDMERKRAHGCTIQEICEQRIGHWICMYVVLQALPMLACDAPSLKWTKGCEYFLCEPPRSGVPWASPEAAQGTKRNWYSVGDAGGVVSLPSDVIEHGVEGIYRRSHCWQMAEKWSADNPILNAALHEQEGQAVGGASYTAAPGLDLPPPPVMPGASLRPGSAGSNRSSKRLSTLNLGLEALPLPQGVTPDRSAPFERPRSSHNVDSAKTFDAILGGIAQDKKGKKK
ncbi:hypothetical protein K431DRAFT_280090 [Polychaeton citri CBS 116435]|uniref:DUF8004 domain-containing protein n=1 Tax=Polychaeton citri CBS 116435 TaxID=1314669 RepID=A0A9P4UVD5_9PEZI|nr:hypothetical protein K431DRAFT_280090 [Polychaeton citri CBS 116435]